MNNCQYELYLCWNTPSKSLIETKCKVLVFWCIHCTLYSVVNWFHCVTIYNSKWRLNVILLNFACMIYLSVLYFIIVIHIIRTYFHFGSFFALKFKISNKTHVSYQFRYLLVIKSTCTLSPSGCFGFNHAPTQKITS